MYGYGGDILYLSVSVQVLHKKTQTSPTQPDLNNYRPKHRGGTRLRILSIIIPASSKLCHTRLLCFHKSQRVLCRAPNIVSTGVRYVRVILSSYLPRASGIRRNTITHRGQVPPCSWIKMRFVLRNVKCDYGAYATVLSLLDDVSGYRFLCLKWD